MIPKIKRQVLFLMLIPVCRYNTHAEYGVLSYVLALSLKLSNVAPCSENHVNQMGLQCELELDVK